MQISDYGSLLIGVLCITGVGALIAIPLGARAGQRAALRRKTTRRRRTAGLRAAAVARLDRLTGRDRSLERRRHSTSWGTYKNTIAKRHRAESAELSEQLLRPAPHSHALADRDDNRWHVPHLVERTGELTPEDRAAMFTDDRLVEAGGAR